MNELTHRGRLCVVVEVILSIAWAAFTTFGAFAAPDVSTLVYLGPALAVGFAIAAVVTFRTDRREYPPGSSPAAEPGDNRSTLARASFAAPLSGLATRGLAFSIAGPLSCLLAFVMAASTPRADGANIGAGGLFVLGLVMAITGLGYTAQSLVEARRSTKWRHRYSRS